MTCPYAATTAQFIVADCLADRWVTSVVAQTGSYLHMFSCSTQSPDTVPVHLGTTSSKIPKIYRDRGVLVPHGLIATDKARTKPTILSVRTRYRICLLL